MSRINSSTTSKEGHPLVDATRCPVRVVLGLSLLPLIVLLGRGQWSTKAALPAVAPLHFTVGVEPVVGTVNAATILNTAVSAPAFVPVLEVLAFGGALFTLGLGFFYRRLAGDAVPMIAGMICLAAASVDVIHGWNVSRSGLLVHEFPVQLAWGFCRAFTFLILILGGTVLRNRSIGLRPDSREFLGLIGLVLAGSVYAVVSFSVAFVHSPLTPRHTDHLARVWNILPMFLLAYAYICVYSPLRNQRPSNFTESMVLMLIPQGVAQVHLSLALYSPLENHFAVANALEAMSFMIPFIGLGFDLDAMVRERAEREVHSYREQLQEIQKDLVERRLQVEDTRRHLEKELEARGDIETTSKKYATFYRAHPLPAMELTYEGRIVSYNDQAMQLVHGVGGGNSRAILPPDFEALLCQHSPGVAVMRYPVLVGSHRLEWMFLKDSGSKTIFAYMVSQSSDSGSETVSETVSEASAPGPNLSVVGEAPPPGRMTSKARAFDRRFFPSKAAALRGKQSGG